MRTPYWAMMPVISDVSPGLSRPDTLISTSSLIEESALVIGRWVVCRTGVAGLGIHLDPVDPLQATRQLVPTPAALAQIMLQIRLAQGQMALARIQHQLIPRYEQGNGDYQLLSGLRPCR